MSIRIREDNGNSGLFQSGNGSPLHMSPRGTIFVDRSQGVAYINKDSLSNWAYFIDSTTLNTVINTYTTTGITVSSQTLTTSISYYGISYSGNVNLTLPSPVNNDGISIIIKDEGGYSGTYRIRLIPPTGTIDGGSYADMNTNYISLTLIARNNNWWII
jgi:hypothetical protein